MYSRSPSPPLPARDDQRKSVDVAGCAVCTYRWGWPPESAEVPAGICSARVRSVCEPATWSLYFAMFPAAPSTIPACGTPSRSITWSEPHVATTEKVDDVFASTPM